MGVRIGSCAMTGFTSSTPQRLSSVVMAMFALYQATGRYAIRCLQRVVNLVPAPVCLALGLASALVFSGAVGAAAQDTTAPVGVFELPASHDGITPFTAVIVFDEEPKRIWPLELVGLLIRGSTDPETQTQPVQIYTNTDHAPLITNRRKDDNDKRRYLFDVTPRAPVDIRFRLSGGYTDIAGNVGPTISSPAIPYVAPAGGNNQPEANAGPDQVVDPGDTVTLDGSESSDRDGNETITYSWARTGGTTGVTAPTLTGSTTDSPTFTADTLTSGDDDVVHVFTLTVTDDHEETDTDTMTVTVEAPDTNPAPISSAGVDQEVISGALVTLDGSASGDDGWIVSWAWKRTGGSDGLDGTVPLNNPNAIKPTFTANTLAVGGSEVIHIFTLIVTDNEGATNFDTVMVTVKAPLFAAPVANAGPNQTFDPGATVTLDGSGSTSDHRRTPLDYAWKRTGGTADPVTLAGANTAMPTFTAVAPALLPSTPFATHIFELTVTDSAGEISTDTVTVWIVIPTTRSVPVADAGMDRTVTSRAEVRLDGSGSTVHSSRTIRSYAWRWVKQLSTPNVEAITLTDPNTAMASFTAPALDVGAKDITHVFELTVTDSAGQTNKDTVSITVIFPFANPVANAGQDRKVGSGTVVTLDGSDSTVDPRRPDASKSYAWARTGGTGDNTVTLTSETTARPSFMAETLASNATDVTHIFTLTVTDSAGVQHTDTVTITVTLGNADPVANAGDDQPAVVSGTTVTLDGSRSSDSDGSISKFAWARTGGTGDASITLSSDSVAEPTFRAEILQTGAADVTHIFTLTVTDDDQATATDTVTITVTPANAVPIANAGPDRTVDPATMVQLDGSDSLDIDGRIVSWAWARTGGTAGGSATLTDAMTARPTFTSDALQMDDDDVIHIFTLTVTDDDGGINTATVTITVSFGDTVPPIGRFEAEDGGPVPHSYGSLTAFKLALVFNEEVTFDASDVTTVISDETPVKDGIPFKDRIPTVMGFEQDKTDAGRYVFIVTPEDTAIPSFRIVLRARNYQDSAGNRGVADIVTAPILYVDPTITNIAPVADAGDDLTVNSGMRNVRLDGTGSSDTEGEIRTYAWARTGGTAGGSVTLSDESAAQPTFTADTLTPGGADVTHEFTLTVTDMSRHAIHEQTRQRNPETGVTTIISDTRNPVPSACRDGRASDEHCTLAYRNSAEDTVTVTIDAPPLADAGDDQTAGSAVMVTLDGSGSSDSNTGFTHAWEWTGGSEGATAPTLNDKTMQSPTFTSDTVDPGAADVTHTFMLTVTDSRLQSHTDTVTVTVSNPNTNADPVANAGPDREVLAGTVVTLNGSGSSDSDGDDTITTYSWARTGGTGGVTAPTLAATAQPTFTADALTPGDADVIHIFTLTVTDNAGATDTDTVTITVVAEDTTRPTGSFVSPASHDGATSFAVELVFNEEVEFSEDDIQTVLVGVPTQNRGSNPRFRYDLDTHVPTISGFTRNPNDNLRYAFFVTPKVPLSLRIALRGRHYADLSGNAGANISTLAIPFSGPSNKRPVAEAGDDLTVASGTEVTLDGSESMDDDGTVQYYAWVRTGGTGDPLALTGADTDMPTFTPRLSGGADDVTHIFTLWVSDNDLAVSEADTVTVMVTAPTAPNMVPVANAGDDRTVQSGAPVTLDGGESSDGDGTIKSWAWTRTGGTGNASLALTNANREQSTFTADTLAPGAEDVTHIFSLVVLDDIGVPSVADTVTITVNAPPLANAGSDQTADSAALVTLDGSGSRDSNTTNLTYAWERTGGTTGGTATLTGANTNMPTFTADTLAVGADNVIHTFTLTVTDDEGATNTDTVTITVDGPNKPPVANAGLDQTVASGEMVTLDGRGSTDSDGFVKRYDWRPDGFGLPTLTANDMAIVTFEAPAVAPGAPDQMFSYALFVTDNEDLGSGSGDSVTITVTPPSSNIRPVANAGTDQTVAPGATVTLEGSGTDNGGTIQEYYWVKASTGTAPTLSANNVARPTLTVPTLVEGDSDVTFTYALRVKDNSGAVSDADEVTITVEAPRVADAGMDQTVAAGATVTLDGSGSSGTIAEYQWSRVSGTSTRADVFPGTSGTLTREVSRITPTITFVADNVPSNGTPVTHVFALRVFGTSRISSPKDEITVTVNPNRLPTANAGPDQSVAAGANVDLDGSGSIDNDGTIASYNWTRTEGDATATLTGANTATPSFTAEVLDAGAADTTHIFILTVTDNNGETDTDTVTVTVEAPDVPNAGPIANPGSNRTVASGATVTLDGSGSTASPGSTITWYAWGVNDSSVSGCDDPPPSLSNAPLDGEAQLSFTAEVLDPGAADVTYCIDLSVRDSAGGRSPFVRVKVTVEAPPANMAPVANAGPDQTIKPGRTVTLDGTGSTDDDRITSYSWNRTGGTCTVTTVFGGVSSLTGTNALPSFTAETLASGVASCTHDFKLFVTDNDGVLDGTGDSVTVTIIATAENQPPIARGGANQTVASGATVTLDGSLSSDDGSIATYLWNVTSPDQVKIPPTDWRNGTTATPRFTAETLESSAEDVIYHFSLRVQDNEGLWSNIDHMRVTVEASTAPVNEAPVANAGPDQTIKPGRTVTLDGTGSTDDDRIASYSWNRTGGTCTVTTVFGGVSSLTGTNALPSFTAETLASGVASCTHDFKLFVTDNDGVLDGTGDSVTVTIIATAENQPPIARMGANRTVASGTGFLLDGVGSTDDGAIGEYEWWRLDPSTSDIGLLARNPGSITGVFVTENILPGDADIVFTYYLNVKDNEGTSCEKQIAGGNNGELFCDSVAVTVIAPFATPVASAVTAESEYASGATVTLDGSGSSVDRRRTATYSWARTGGTTGGMVTFSPSATVESPTFTADTLTESDSDVTHIFTLTVTDGEGGSATDMVTIIVKAPVPVSDTTGPKATTFRALGLAQNNHDGMTPINFEVVFDEPIGDESNGESTFTAEDINRAPWNVPAGEDAATHTATISKFMKDPANPLRYTFTLTPGVDSSGSGSRLAFTVSIPQDKITDAIGNKNLNIRGPHLTYSAPSANTRPVAHAGVDQTKRHGELVTLDGSGSMDKEGKVTYSWARTGGTKDATVTLSDPSAQMPTFTANAPPGTVNVVHIFTLTVTDEGGLTDDATVEVAILSPFLTLTANAGVDQEVVSGATVTLDGSASIVDGRTSIAQYSWARTGGTGGTVTLSPSATVVRPTFTADTLAEGAADVTHVFTLTVTDNEDRTATDTVTITVTAPVPADTTRPRVSTFSQPLTHDGMTPFDAVFIFSEPVVGFKVEHIETASQETHSSYVFSTSQPLYSNLRQDPNNERRYTFTVTPRAPLWFKIGISENKFADAAGNLNRTFSTSQINYSDNVYLFPVADAGLDQTVASGATVTLDGGGSTGTGDLFYMWIKAGTGNHPTLSNGGRGAVVTFTAPTLASGAADVILSYELGVVDNSGFSNKDTVTITVEAPDAPRVAAAGDDQTVAAGATVTLDGSGSTVVNGPISKYNWTRESGTSTRTTIFATDSGGTTNQREISTPTTTFVADSVPANGAAVTHVIALRVLDANGIPSPKDEMTVTVNPNQLPVANAGVDRSFDSGVKVTLEGSGTDSDSDATLTYSWAWTSGTGASVTLTDANTATPSFTADVLDAGAADITHTFTLTVTDNNGETDTDTVTVTITAPSSPPNAKPTAVVMVTGGQTTVQSGAAVEITGTGTDSDSDDDTLDYAWTRTGGTGGAVDLTGENTPTLSFMVETLEADTGNKTYIFELVVTDTKGAASDPVAVTITAVSPLKAPVAHAGEDQDDIASGATGVTLDGRGSTGDSRRTLDYFWTRTGGSGNGKTVTDSLFGADSAMPTFSVETLAPGVPDVTHIFQLRVRYLEGGAALSAPSTVTITVNAPFADPVANAVITGGHTSVTSGGTVMLDGRGSTKDRRRNITTYAWTGETAEVTASLTDADMDVATFRAETLTVGAPDVTHTFTLTVTDSAGASDTATVMITVTSNAIPVATVTGGNQTVASGAAVTLTGSGTDSDSDDDTLDYAWVRTGGTGNAAVALTGEDTKTLSFTADTLVAGTVDKTHVFELVVTDDKGAESAPVEVTITIESAIASPVANAGPDQPMVASGTTVTLDGSGSTVDFRKTPRTFAWARTSGTGDSNLTLTNPNAEMPTFTADTLVAEANPVTHTFTLTVTDSDNRTATDTVEVTIISPFADPVANAVITGGHTMVTSGGTVMLDGRGSTTDRRRTIMSHAWTGETSGVTADLTNADKAVATFTAEILAADAPDVTHTFTLTVTDSAGETDTDTVMITVTSGFVTPVAMIAGGNRSVATGTPVTLDGSGSTFDSRATVTYGWTRTGGTGMATVALTGEDTARLSFTADALTNSAEDVTHEFTLTVTDNKGGRSTATVTITVTSGFVAYAGPDQTITSNFPVVLDGSGSRGDSNGGPVASYAWKRTGGTSTESVMLNNSNEAMPSFTADSLERGAEDVTHVFTLTVTDSMGRTSTDMVTITIISQFALPNADAGDDRTVSSGTTVKLDGSGTTVDRRSSVAYTWIRSGGDGASVTLSNTNVEQPTFTAVILEADADDVTLEFTLTVTDSKGKSDSDTVTITVTDPFDAPVANAGVDREYGTGTLVTLDGSGSTVDSRRTIKSYLWERKSGTGGSVTLSDASVEQPTFTADTLADGDPDVTHDFTLTVTDSADQTSTDMVTITVTSGNAVPVAHAGMNQEVVSGATVTLDGSKSSDSDGTMTIKTYTWTRTGGTGGTVTLTNETTAMPSFTADTLVAGAADVTHVFELVVTDDENARSVAASVTITVTAPFKDPVADAGADRTIAFDGNPVTLDGSASTMDRRRSLDYDWTRTGGTGGTVTLTNETTAMPSFTPATLEPGAADGIYIFTLTVTDSANVTATDTVTITVTAPFKDPVANAGADRTVAFDGNPVTLDGRASTMDRRRSLNYAWTWTSGSDVSVSLVDGTTAQPSFTPATLEPGADDVTHTFTLTVTDSAGASDTDTVTITVTAPFADPVANAVIKGGHTTVGSGGTVMLDGSGSTKDRRRTIASYAWTGETPEVTADLTKANEAEATFAAETLVAGAPDVTHTFTLTVTDNTGASDTDTVMITVTAPFANPVANAGADRTVAFDGNPVTLDGSASTMDRRRSLDYAWTWTSGSDGSVSLVDRTSAQPSFTPATLEPGAADVTHTFTLTVTDSAGASDTDTVTITVTAPFADPVANAVITGGHTSVASGGTVMLDGSDSTKDRRRTITSYAWAGETPEVTADLTNADMDVATFRAETLTAGAPDVTHTFTLTVTDSAGASDTDTVTITVTSNAIPVATVTGGNQIVASEAAVTLTGSGTDSDSDDDMLDYAWVRTGGTGNAAVALTGKDTKTLSFTADTLEAGARDVTHVFELVVTDDKGTESAPVEVTITIESAIAAPVARAVTDQSEYTSGAMVTLDGNGSTVDFRKTPKTHNWVRTDGTGDSNLTLTNADEAEATFTADTLVAGALDVTHTFTLTVTDSDNRTATDTVEVTITSLFADPVASAVIKGGHTTVASGETVMLDGTGSAPDRRRTIASYIWTGETAEVTRSLTNANTNVATFTAEILVAGAPDVTHTFTLTVTDNTGASDTATVMITVTSNAIPVATVTGGNQTVASGAAVTLTGSGTDSDSDNDMLDYAWVRTGGTGNAAVALTGKDTKTLSFMADTLVPGALDVTHVFELVVTDDKGTESTPVEVTITIESAIAAPVASAVTDQPEYASGATVTLDGSGSTVDFRKTPKIHAWTGETPEITSSLTNADEAEATFTADTLAAGAPDVTHTFTLTVMDSDNRMATNAVEVTINAPFADPVANAVITGGHTTVASGETVMLDGNGSTKDRRRTIASYAWAGETPEVTADLTNADMAVATFRAETLVAGAPSVTHTFTLTVTDSAGASDTATVTIMVISNALPIATVTGGNQIVASGVAVTLTGSGTDSDSDDDMLTYAWVRTGGTGNAAVALTGKDTKTLSFMADTLVPGAPDVTHVFELVVTDDKGTESAAVEVTITIESAIAEPVARAVTAQPEYTSGATVTLDGSGSTIDFRKTPKTHAWTGETPEITTSLTNADEAMATFTADRLAAGAPDVTHTFTLTVRDRDNRMATDTVEVTINAPFADPVANAGDDQDNIVPGTTVTLDGSDSTKDRRRTITSYAWARTGGTTGSSATLSSMTAERPTFTANALAPGAPDVTHIFTLTVTDSAGMTDMDMVEITVISRFAPPVANAGADQNNISSGATVTLDGSGSTKDRRKTLGYSWARTGGTGGAARLSSTTAEQPTFTAETLNPGAPDVTYIFTLTVTDDTARDDDMVTITVISPFADPVANAVTARPEVGPGDTVILDGSGSTKDRRRTIASYAWVRTGGTGANVTLTGATEAMASFTADMLVAGAENVTHTFTLTVTDSAGEIATDTVEVIVTANVRPVATLTGPATLTVAAGASVTLEGSGTDRDNNVPLAYAWKRTGGTGNSAVALTGAMTTRLSFTADNLTAGADSVTHTFEFVVTDHEGAESDPVTVTVTIDAPNAIPVANAGPPPPPVASGGQIQLDGRGSSVPGGTIVAWAWTRTGGTPGATVTLTGADTAQPIVMANDLEPGGPDEIHEFTLIVTDDEGMTSAGAMVTVTITAPIAAPVANAGPDQRAVSRATVRLDGRGSTPDRRKTIASYAWERTGGTGDSTLTLTGANTAQPTFTADTLNPGVESVTHVFTLTVTDEDGMTSTDTVTVTVVSVDLRLSQSEIMVQEGGSGTYRVKLSESPLREVTIMAVSGNEDVVKLNNARLVFDGGNWNEWQQVEINSVAGSNTNDPVVIRHRLVTAGATSPVPGDVTVTLRPRADDPIPRPVGQFLQNRATALINNQPDLSFHLEPDRSAPGGNFTFQATDGQLALNGGFIHNSVWGKVTGAYASNDSATGNTGSVTKSVLASFGVHRKYSEHFLAGVMLQLDISDHDRAGQVGMTDTIDGTGWLAGPYFATRHGTQPLYFEGRLLYGQSDNDIRFMDAGLGRVRTGSFDTRRLLAQIRVEGEIAMSGRNHGHDGNNGDNENKGHKNGPLLRPYADLRWVEDRAEAFTDNIRNRVPGQSVSIGQLELGSNIEIPMAVRTGELTFIGGLGLVYSKTKGDYIQSESRAHGRGEIGFSYDLDDNLRIDLESFYDGIGNSRYEGYGLSLSAEMKF